MYYVHFDLQFNTISFFTAHKFRIYKLTEQEMDEIYFKIRRNRKCVSTYTGDWYKVFEVTK